jgi:intein/homing endonuclease
MSAVKAFFSGVEGQSHFQACVDAGVTHCLASFLYLQKKDLDLIKKRKRKHPHISFLIDSGAHTFQTDYAKFQHWSKQDFENYVQEYSRWLLKNKDYIFAGVELDIDFTLNMLFGGSQNSSVGLAMVENWQRKYFQPLQEQGVDICYVWHKERKLEGWEEMCSKFPYVGLPGEMSAEPDFNKFVSVAKRYNTKVHGFAASVTGDSKLIVKSPKGGLNEITIEKLFAKCAKHRVNSVETVGYLDGDYKTWTLTDDLKTAFRSIRAVIRHRSKKPIYEISLRGGKTIRGTGDHSFFSLTSQGDLIEVKPSQLAKGDHLVSSLGLPDCRANGLIPEIAEFAGIWFGDGYINVDPDGVPRSIWVSKQHQPEIRERCERMAALCDRKWSTVPNTVDGYFTDTLFAEWLMSRFGRIGEDKRIGSAILTASKESQAAFLRGYFSADGSAKGSNRLISLTCFRRDILELVQIMLERWDIRSGITEDSISGKGGHTWELAISDQKSRENFEREIGFIQQSQRSSLAAKNGTRPIAGCHRGLPVNLLKTGRLYFNSRGTLKSRKLYAKDRRTAEIPENFCDKLLEMDCEYLEISDIKLVSTEEVDVYDLEVPATERFFANGILAHNTKQADFRDWPWYSVDSITWKTCEMYGTLIHWDKHKQVLFFDADKSNRAAYRADFERLGLDADGIINDTNYKEVTKYALSSMRAMEAFYEHKYADRLAYYDTRLPHPQVVLRANPQILKKFWDILRPSTLFKNHAGETDFRRIRSWLAALAAVQFKDYASLKANVDGMKFLEAYFPKLVTPTLVDETVFQKELAAYVAPPNPPALARTEREHYIPTNNVPKVRDIRNLTSEDLEWNFDPDTLGQI